MTHDSPSHLLTSSSSSLPPPSPPAPSQTDVAVLDWQYRRSLIQAEIAAHAPDILCVQELQGNAAGAGVDDHHAGLQAHLKPQGYDGRYVRKMKRTGCGWPTTQIGNALFWRTQVFEYVEHQEVLIAVALNQACADEPSRQHFGRGAQVGLVVALRHRASATVIVATTTHLSCNFQEPWTQVAQMQTVLTAAGKLAAKHGPATPVVMGADLNSIPGSGVYHLVASGHLPSSHPHLKIIAEHVDFPEFGGGGGGGGGDVRQPLQFGGCSAYASLLGQEPLFTNFTPNFVGCLDYIFSTDGLQPTQVLKLPTEDVIRSEGYLPASQFASDHLPLVARFKLATNANQPPSRLLPTAPEFSPSSSAASSPQMMPPPAALPSAIRSLMPPPAPITLPPSAQGGGAASSTSTSESPLKRCRSASGASESSAAAYESAASSAASSPHEGGGGGSGATLTAAALGAVSLGDGGGSGRQSSHGGSSAASEDSGGGAANGKDKRGREGSRRGGGRGRRK